MSEETITVAFSSTTGPVEVGEEEVESDEVESEVGEEDSLEVVSFWDEDVSEEEL